MKKSLIYLSKIFISIIITLIILILIKSNSSFKNTFYKEVYDTNISFSTFNKFYNKYISKIDILNIKPVFNEKRTYNKIEKYLDGVKLYVEKNTAIKSAESGIVIYIGNKDNYNNTVVIQRIDGVDEWYGNINNVGVKLYDYVSKGTIIGEADDYYYLVYKKDGKNLNYEEYIK